MLKILTKEELTKQIAVVLGTRPGIIKFSPVIKALEDARTPFFIIHTGQHYSYNMDRQFFEDLGLPEPRYKNDHVRNEKYHGTQTAEMIKGIEKALLESKPKVVIVGGDANTNLAGALAARKLGLILAHMEAGLRSKDWRMPEEHNRVMIDHISDIVFAPTETNVKNLIADNVKGEIVVTGNTIVDAVYRNQELALKKSRILERLRVTEGGFILLTVHREENVDSEAKMKEFSEMLDLFLKEQGMRIIFPIHPRTKERLSSFGLYDKIMGMGGMTVIDPVGYLDMLAMMRRAKLICTDSGGIQEEACILRRPCLTLRDNTERPETVTVGANKIVGFSVDRLREAVGYFERQKAYEWDIPYGDGKAAERIAARLAECLDAR
jgi:UDP-N-acetylglucosamine 2-epimerase (non-hydrolysing)